MQDKENQELDTKELIVNSYKSIVQDKKSIPVYTDFLSYDISRAKIRTHFGGIELLHDYMKQHFYDFLGGFYSSVEDIFSPNRQIGDFESGKYVITTAVADSPADVDFLNALKSYCKRNNAKLVIMPCESITNSFENRSATFDPYFNDPSLFVVSEDKQLNDNFSLCSIQVSAKQIKSITGLSRLGNREGSYVFASPKQFLEYVPSGNNRGKNYAIMTPGACTKSAYFSETYVSKRLSYIAEKDHTIGAIIVEILNDKLFDFRQIQAAEDGSFNDMGIEYRADGSVKRVNVNIVFGDLHGVQVDHEALDYFLDLVSDFEIDNVVLHDVFDGQSISHHIQSISSKSKRSLEGLDDLYEELIQTFNLLDYIDKKIEPKNIKIAKSNHDEFLDRYLADGNYVFDPKNHYLSLKLATALFEKTDVLKHAFKTVSVEVPDNWEFLSRGDSFAIGGVECGSHGDLGMNGAKPSMASLERIYGSCIVGHNHTAGILRKVFRVGTLSKLNLGYNRGPSSWTHTCAIIYDNGQIQLINYVK